MLTYAVNGIGVPFWIPPTQPKIVQATAVAFRPQAMTAPAPPQAPVQTMSPVPFAPVTAMQTAPAPDSAARPWWKNPWYVVPGALAVAALATTAVFAVRRRGRTDEVRR